ncbi:TetR/AcrR family transcriptional regulator [Flavobacterium adhaerens]|uniref:TetR/AcrR family transcriptional regulator n=1 Tax=Flavobacterium adhaerens TaxID=3149043 RepID=UPI0032B45FF3
MSILTEKSKIKTNQKLYLKDPETSELGKKIIQNSILLIDEIGLEHFTFKKLGERIQSNESSIYRYFENKHKLVIYLSTWYWSWIENKLIQATDSIENPTEKLKRALIVVTEKIIDDDSTKHINESILNKIIIFEFNKALYTKDVDEDNKYGYFLVYKSIINLLASFILEVNPEYSYSKSLASTIVEGSLHQHFLNDHLKTITDCNETKTVTSFYNDLVTRILKK